MKRFSERMGITKPQLIQLDAMSQALRNSLWNSIQPLLLDYSVEAMHKLFQSFVIFFFKLPLDAEEHEVAGAVPYRAIRWIREKFFSLSWYEVYEFVEFLIQHEEPFKKPDFIKSLNFILEEENSGYRLVNNQFAPITNKQEIESIEGAIKKAKQSDLGGVREHLSQATSLLALKPEPDYRNSIKESISAVESLVKNLSGVNSGGLESALKELSKKIPIHGALQKGFTNLYGYTSDEDGIRHAILEDPNVGYDEAKFMLVTCSAFVNFLISKAQKA